MIRENSLVQLNYDKSRVQFGHIQLCDAIASICIQQEKKILTLYIMSDSTLNTCNRYPHHISAQILNYASGARRSKS